MGWLLLVASVVFLVVLFARRTKKTPDFSHLPEQFVVFDLETTGLDAYKHEIIEIGAIRVNRDSVEHDAFQALVIPSKKIPREITELTGITQAMIDSEGVPLDQAMRDFVEFIGDLRLVAFNAEFDMAFLKLAAERTGHGIRNPVSCALKMARRAYPRLKSYRLADLAKIGNLPTINTHRAIADCERALIVYTASAARLKTIR